jgi:hypothetical protein
MSKVLILQVASSGAKGRDTDFDAWRLLQWPQGFA